MCAAVSSRPSDARRAKLSQADSLGEDGVPLVSNFFPIERYYDAVGKLLASFEKAYQDKRLDDAYVYGKRFATFSINALPKHNYYKSPKYAKLRTQNSKDMENVIVKLEQVAKWMDVQEQEREKERKRREVELRRRQEELRRQKEAAERRRIQEFQDRLNQQKRQHSDHSVDNVEQSAFDKLQQLSGMFPAVPSGPPGLSESEHSNVSDEDDPGRGGLGRQQSSRSDQGHSHSSISVDGLLPPPMPPPTDSGAFPPPPSYEAAVQGSKQAHPGNGDLFPPSATEAAAFGIPAAPPPGVVRPPTVLSDGPTYANREREREREALRKTHVNIPMRKLRAQYVADYTRLRQEKRIQIFGLDTHQGRFPCSTNGCAVISPLVVSRHLKSHLSVSDDDVVDVIDRECGPILRDIRGKLGLEGGALIIPSDVHDHLVDHKLLSQAAFIGATGGNIMDKEHIGQFLKLLDSGEDGKHKDKKTGAALFFREHVVSIVKVPRPDGSFFYDLIDSLPGMTDHNNRRMATRTRCHDIAAFESLINWYASTKFSESNNDYMDRNEWDDTMADFDPRVFQTFVWGTELKQ